MFNELQKKLIHQVLFLMLLISSVAFYAFSYQESFDKASNHIGYVASLASIIMFGSPLAQIVTCLVKNSIIRSDR